MGEINEDTQGLFVTWQPGNPPYLRVRTLNASQGWTMGLLIDLLYRFSNGDLRLE